MNNYVGVGVDAKVSLVFHRLRDQFPQWFRSQMGNKVWYTTMGAADILGHAIGASSGGLPSKLKACRPFPEACLIRGTAHMSADLRRISV